MRLNIFHNIISSNKKKFIVLQQNSLGSIGLSFHAIKLLTEKRVMSVPAVRKVKADVWVSSRGINLDIILSVSPGSEYKHLPGLTNDLVREELSDKADIDVYRLKVTVQDDKD